MLAGFRGIVLMVCALSVAPISGSVYAENQGPVQSVLVTVRSLRAMNPIGEDRPDGLVKFASGRSQEVECDRSIGDLKSKLQKLNYRTFKLVNSESRVIAMTHRETMNVGGGDTLTLRPIYVQSDKIGMFLDWQDSDGTTILNTRMHFKPGESVLTGTDHSSESGIILAIEVKPE